MKMRKISNAIKKEFNSNPVYILIPESQIKIL